MTQKPPPAHRAAPRRPGASAPRAARGEAAAQTGAPAARRPGRTDAPGVRRLNLSRVARAVHDEAEITRAAVAERLGLTRAAVSSLVEQLMAAGFVAESGKTFSGQAGRPGTALTMARTGHAGLGVSIDVDALTVCLVDLGGAERLRLTEPGRHAGAGPRAVLRDAALLTGRALRVAAREGLAPAGVDLALPGLVAEGVVRQAPNLGWNAVPAEDLFAEALRADGAALPVSSDNEANSAALAQLWSGAPGGARTFVYLSGDIGVGGAVVLDGDLLRGAHGFAGEIGHLVVDPNGPDCRCGSRGCLEQYAGQDALLRAGGLTAREGVAELARRAGGTEPPGAPETLRARQAIEQAGTMLGIALSGAVNLLDPETVILGGLYRELAHQLAPAAERELERRVVSGLWGAGSGRLRAASSAGDAARGAAGQVLRRILADPLAYAGAPSAP
ncbi:ROK family protein [Streptomyces sp. NPDC058373]|uniref:ROK family transcriptional regulator n=1 Tax=Streptomyces sp. NPDC058373 TaxID=3346465 RepID=UPI0036564CA2